MTVILTASLCKYLTARFAQKSWIKSDKIPYMIGVFLVSETVTQTSAAFCYTHIIAVVRKNQILTANVIYYYFQLCL